MLISRLSLLVIDNKPEKFSFCNLSFMGSEGADYILTENFIFVM